MRQLFKPILAMSALALSGLGLMAPVTPASAAMVPQVPAYSHVQGSGVQLPVELVARRHRYDRHRHGNRYRHRRHGYGHYYGGYWYRTPWWILGTGLAIGAGAAAAGSNNHVQWCLNRYRSYNVRTDTYRGYDGYDHRCNSPYR